MDIERAFALAPEYFPSDDASYEAISSQLTEHYHQVEEGEDAVTTIGMLAFAAGRAHGLSNAAKITFSVTPKVASRLLELLLDGDEDELD